MNFKDKLRQFFTGRYGGDSLNTFICVISMLSLLAASIVTSAASGKTALAIGLALFAVAAVLVGFAAFRVFSRNLAARRKEYDWFRRVFVIPFTRKKNEAKTRSAQKDTHRFFKCPGCRQTVRVPKGKGKIRITCPKCGKVFERKS